MNSGFPGRFFTGLVAGAVVAAIGGGAVSCVLSVKAKGDARRDWDLSPVVVPKRDLNAGDAPSTENVDYRLYPEAIITSSLVKPDSASYVIGQRLLVPVKAGQPLQWYWFAVAREEFGRVAHDARDACESAYAQVPGAPQPDATVDAIVARVKGARP